VYAPSAEAFRGGGSSTVAGGWSIDANVERWGKRERERNIYIVVNIYIYIYIYIKREREQGSFATQQQQCVPIFPRHPLPALFR
jgi:hypothetical protein